MFIFILEGLLNNTSFHFSHSISVGPSYFGLSNILAYACNLPIPANHDLE